MFLRRLCAEFVLCSFIWTSCVTGSSGIIEAHEKDVELTSENQKDLESCSGPGSDPYLNYAFNGHCNCKRNVRDVYCLECKQGTFDLSYKHKRGCLKCFCSGLSKECSSSDLFRNKIETTFREDSEGLSLVYANLRPVEQELFADTQNNEIYVDNLPEDSNNTYYWKLPEKFLKDKLTSYGGFINFTINYDNLPPSKHQQKWLKDPLLFIQGNGLTLYYKFRKRNRKVSSHYLPLIGNNWFKLRTKKRKTQSDRKTERKNGKVTRRRKRARRRDLMKVLANIEFIFIKANYKPKTTLVGLKNLSISSTTHDSKSNERAFSVEKCQCPRGYLGMSCQSCSRGFTRNLRGPRKQKYRQPPCQECQCNGRANICDPETGICINCQNNSTGDFCENSLLQCDKRGTFSLEPDPTRCKCKSRVEGELCNICRGNYFDLDYENRKSCRKCWCSGVSLRCRSSTLRRFQIRVQPRAAISLSFKLRDEKKAYLINFYNGKALYRPYTKYRQIYKLHWSLPKIFTGNLLKSYGGYLNFSLTNKGHCESLKYVDPLLELESFYGRILRWKFTPPIRMNSPSSYSIKLIEDHFVYTFNQFESSRSTFMEVLKDLRSIRIYVPECSHISSTEIRDIVLDTSTDSSIASGNPLSSAVEKCDCSAAYSGLSCEYCAPGYEFDSFRRCVRKTNLNYFRN